VLGIGVPSLPLVTLKRWMENFDALAISWKICEVEASEGTETVSGKPLMGRPGSMSVTKQNNYTCIHTARAHDKCEGGRGHGGVSGTVQQHEMTQLGVEFRLGTLCSIQ
jgi:hypothetical protein